MSRLPTFERGQSVADWNAEEMRGLVDTVRDLRDWMEITKRLHLPDLARLKRKVEAEELDSTAPYLVALGDYPGQASDSYLIAFSTLRREPSGSLTDSPYKYFTVHKIIAGAFAWPGRDLGWYRANVHLHPLDTPADTEIQPRHVRLLRFVRYWEPEDTIYKHQGYID